MAEEKQGKYEVRYWIEDEVVETELTDDLEEACTAVLNFDCSAFDEFHKEQDEGEEEDEEDEPSLFTEVRERGTDRGAIFWCNTEGDRGTDTYGDEPEDVQKIIDKYLNY